MDMNMFAFLARLRFAMFGADVWFDYVPSASNVTFNVLDLHTRLGDSAAARLNKLGEPV